MKLSSSSTSASIRRPLEIWRWAHPYYAFILSTANQVCTVKETHGSCHHVPRSWPSAMHFFNAQQPSKRAVWPTCVGSTVCALFCAVQL